MDNVTSKDGTIITYDRLGQGPAVILVCGGSVDRMSNACTGGVAGETVHGLQLRPSRAQREWRYATVRGRARDRGYRRTRGCGGGVGIPLWRVVRGGARPSRRRASSPAGSRSSHVGGAVHPDGSPGHQQIQRRSLATWSRRAARRRCRVLHGEGRRTAAGVRRTGAHLAVLAESGGAGAHTRLRRHHHGRLYVLPIERVAEVKIPTLVMDGGASFPFMRVTAQALVDHLPNPQRATLEGQGTTPRLSRSRLPWPSSSPAKGRVGSGSS